MLKDENRIFQNLYNDRGSDVESSKKRNYISSLYPVGNSINKFKLDYQGSTYFLSIEGESAIIKSTL